MKRLSIIILCIVALSSCKNDLGKSDLRKQVNNGDIVFYTPNGNCYHSSNNCPTLNHSNNILNDKLNILNGIPKTDACDVCIKPTEEQLEEKNKQREVQRIKDIYKEYDEISTSFDKYINMFTDSAFGGIKYINFPANYNKWNEMLDKAKEEMTSMGDIAFVIKHLSDEEKSLYTVHLNIAFYYEYSYNNFVEIIKSHNKSLKEYNDWAYEYNINFFGTQPYLDEYYAVRFTQMIDFDEDGEKSSYTLFNKKYNEK